jgi:cell division inhibitor SepF
MGSKLMNKFWDLLGVDPDADTSDNLMGEEQPYFPDETTNKKSKVIGMPGMQQVKVIISQPSSFEQSQEICEHLKDKKSIIVNLEYVNKDVARRIIDFISGAVYGLDGNIQKISNSIFLVAPFNYEITNEVMRDDIKSKLSVSWIK